ncbi:MAG: hypothetical protein K1V95_02800 [Eubacterium sp.]
MVKNRKIPLEKIFALIMLSFLIIAVLFGIATRCSYKVYNRSYNPDDAKVYSHYEIVNKTINNLDSAAVLNEISTFSSAFVVTVEKNEAINKATKATVLVNRVIKGDESLLGSRIAIHQISYVEYDKRLKEVAFDCLGGLSNVMQVGKEYLVFADKIDFYDEFQETLDCFEFSTRPDKSLYYFPIDTKVEYIDYIPEKYGDIKTLDYLCCNKENAQKMQQIVDDILEYYL